MSLIGYLPPKSNPRSITCYAITSAYNYIPMATVSGLVWLYPSTAFEWSDLCWRQDKQKPAGNLIHPNMQCNAIESWVKLKLPERHYILQTDSPMQLWKVSRATGREGQRSTKVSCLVTNYCPLNPRSSLSYSITHRLLISWMKALQCVVLLYYTSSSWRSW